MSTRTNISTRLAKLEKAMPEPAVECAELDWLLRMKTCVLAYHLGDAQPGESVATGYSRALGYESARELRLGLENGDAGQRHEAAMARLFAQHGLDIAAAPFEVCVQLLDTLVPALPKWMMERVGIPAGVTATDALL